MAGFLDGQRADWRAVRNGANGDWLRLATREAASELATRINAAAVLNPVSLVALALLATPRCTADTLGLRRMIAHFQALDATGCGDAFRGALLYGLELGWSLVRCVALGNRTWELSALTGVEVKHVTVRDQRSRWGSCSANGTISLNWRLVQTPESVRDYIIYHELMHLREMNHSARFWARVEEVCPGWREAEHWLKRNGSLLGL